MNAVARISDDIKKLICASSQINNITKVVQELVFNSIDAEATSIAVRIHIGEGNIQVIDNGCGINKNDFKFVGQNYMTSKLVNITTLESMPVKYGFRGQSLANIVQVSKCVKLTSRSEQSDETFTKIFEFGKEKQIVKTKTRSSKGTTVDIKGFLYNISIQQKCSNYLIELQDIKSFLENTSLVQCNLSVSLRDDSTNDIIFQINKNRDIYQTLHSLYCVEETDVQELQVEKNQYKVIAYIAKREDENKPSKQLIFLNGQILSNDSELQKAVNNRFSKQIKCKKAKNQNKCDDNQEGSYIDKIPFYVIFFKCPNINFTLKTISTKTIVDFKDWTEINRLIEKLVRFYNNDINNIKEIKNAKNNIEVNKLTHKNQNTSDQVKQIINKIFGSKHKIPVVSQMHNGVKGKQIQRNRRKRPHAKLTIPKIVDQNINIESNLIKKAPELRKINLHVPNVEKQKIKKTARKNSKIKKPPKKTMTPKVNIVKTSIPESSLRVEHEKNNNKISKKDNNGRITINKKQHNQIALHRKFDKSTDSIKRRYKMLSNEVNKLNNLEPVRIQPKQEFAVQEEIKYCNVTEINKNVSVRKTMNEVTLYESFLMPPHKLNINANNHRIINNKKSLLSSYDILKTILTQQHNLEESSFQNAKIGARNINHNLHMEGVNHYGDAPVMTFNSHEYKNINVDFDNFSRNFKIDQNNYFYNNNDFCNEFRKLNAFITKKSMDSFVSQRGNSKFFLKNKLLRNNDKRNILQKKSFIQNNILKNKEQSSYSIQFSDSNDRNINKYLNCFNTSRHTSSIRNNTEESKSAYTLNHTPHLINLSDNPGSSNYLFQSSDVLQTAKNTTLNAHNTNDNLPITYQQINCHATYTIDEDICKTYTDSIIIHHTGHERYEISLSHNTYLVEPQYTTIPESGIINSNNNITKMSDPNSQMNYKRIIYPIEVCETVQESRDTLGKEFETSFHKTADSYHKVDEENNVKIASNNTEISKNMNQDCLNLNVEQIQNEIQTSHHFIASNIIKDNINTKVNAENGVTIIENCHDFNEDYVECDDVNNFNLRDRLGFLPKGMSQIFRNSNLKIASDFNLTQDYYNDNLYNNFEHKVKNTVEIFEPKVQNASDLVTKDIEKVNKKFRKDNARLKFDGKSLKDSQVLGQVDEKFIAVIIKGKSNDSEILSEFLVLFDQHAVHERIRLETNLSDYITGTEWNAVNLDEVILKITSDDVKFLHNFKEKFAQFGLRWTILNNNEVSLNAIPEAILGKNPRPTDKIIEAVQCLIKEVINNVKLQRGCVFLYPKSIMDLVFSEACRYAIKFNDKLSITDCIELIQKLSDCKTPFQCAHGRPVMAVIMDNKPIISCYVIGNLDKLRDFKKKFASKPENK